MTDLAFGPYRTRTDPERTRAYYAARTPWPVCDCAGCRNFLRAVRTLPEAVTDLFRALGLDPLKPAEVCHYGGTRRNVCASAWYHVHGELLGGGAGPAPTLADGVSVSCDAACDLLPEDFPRPCFQVEFWFDRLPWILPEPNPYSSS
ncbi:MAG: hypothetical protein IJR54_08135 [Oscillibacter sp.]|nr:hypothetical protein [Oscillibacter sp.]